MSTILVNFVSLFGTNVTIFKRKNVSQVKDNFICLDLILTKQKKICTQSHVSCKTLPQTKCRSSEL